jgi:hypothetical protein
VVKESSSEINIYRNLFEPTVPDITGFFNHFKIDYPEYLTNLELAEMDGDGKHIQVDNCTESSVLILK